MRATTIHAPYDMRVEDVPEPVVQLPTDAVLRVLRACICGSDLWAYRGEAARRPGQRIGHEFLGIVEETGSEVGTVSRGDLVVAPFMWSDGVCDYCREGLTTSCEHGGFWGSVGYDGGQGEAVRVPFADGTLGTAAQGGGFRRPPAVLPADSLRRSGHRSPRGSRRRSPPGRHGRRRRRRSRRPVRGTRGQAARRRTDHRPGPSPGPHRHRAPLRCHRRRRRARGRGPRGRP